MVATDEYLDVSTHDLRDRMTILHARLDKGWTYSGDAADRKWITLLHEYERVCDELLRRGQALA